jgi:hypothetical protein
VLIVHVGMVFPCHLMVFHFLFGLASSQPKSKDLEGMTHTLGNHVSQGRVVEPAFGVNFISVDVCGGGRGAQGAYWW